MKTLNKEELNNINGGREVIKIDNDGDGRWDTKIIYYANRTVYRYR